MTKSRRVAALITTLSIAASLPSAALADAGSVRFAKGAESAFDVYTRNPTAAQQTFMQSHYWRMRTYSPYFNSRLSWFKDAWVYRDSMAVYNPSAMADEHPDWILHDASGNRLYIQWGCSNGTCPQFAADVGNADYRAEWIAGAKAQLAAGYRGLFIDDVNMVTRTGDGSGKWVQPIDPRTGKPMSDATWARYLADFMVQVRAALPGIEIVHNALWTVPDDSADVQRQLNAADYIELERGFNDAGIVGGSTYFGFDKLLGFIDHRHAAGHGVILDGWSDTPAGRMYGLATYFLVSSGNDALGNDAYGTPDSWWSGYDVQLGAPAGGRYLSGGVWRRDFARGSVLVNEPGSPSRTVSVGAGFHELDGTPRSSVTLGAASGIVLLRDGADAAAAPPPPAAPTSTTVVTTPVSTPPTVAAPPAAATPARQRARTATTTRARGVRVHGRVRGATRGRVEINVQRKRGRRWVTVARARTAVAGDGRYGRELNGLGRGRFRVRASYLGSGGARPSRSGFRRFSLRG